MPYEVHHHGHVRFDKEKGCFVVRPSLFLL